MTSLGAATPRPLVTWFTAAAAVVATGAVVATAAVWSPRYQC